MNKSIMILLLVSFNAFSVESKQTDQHKLHIIDSWCGDTLCEGEFDYDFTSLKCGTQSCHLEFEKIHEDTPD